MAMQSKNQHLGHVGEVEIIRDLLDIGASINSLSSSDYGWDLHVHLPEDAMLIGNVSRNNDGLQEFKLEDLSSWNMSGHTANVQVKKQTSITPPSVSISTLRGWLLGARIGVPTFVFIIKDGHLTCHTPSSLNFLMFNFSPPKRYKEKIAEACASEDEAIERHHAAEEWEMEQAAKDRALVAESKVQETFESLKVPLRGGAKITKQNLARLLYIWTRYPQIMLVGGFDDLIREPKRQRKSSAHSQAIQLAAELAVAWLRDHDDSRSQDQNAISQICEAFGSVIMEKFTLSVDHDRGGKYDIFNAIEQGVSTEISSRNGYAPNSYSKIYTCATDASVAETDAIRILSEISEFMRGVS